jgi:hypothetical protein
MNFSRIRYSDYLFAIAAYLFVSFLILSGFILSPGTIGFFHDWFLGPFEEMNETWAKSGPYAWDSQLGNKVYSTDWLFRLVLSVLPSPFLGGEVLSKGLLIIILTLSGFGAYCLGKRLKLSPYVSFATGILYIFSPIIFTRIVAGYIYYLVAYFLSPLILASFLKGKEENKNRYFIIAALLLSFATVQIQFLPMVFLILLIFSLVDFKRIKKSIKGLFIVMSLTSLMILSPILLSQLIVKTSELPFNPKQLLSYFTVATASDLAKSFRMLGYEGMPYSYLNLGTGKDLFSYNVGIIPVWVFYVDFLLPIIGFSVLFFRRDKYAISFALVSVIGLYLLKGTNPPFSGFFAFLFTNVLYIFRELWHIAFLYSFSITFLVAFFIDRLRQFKSKPVVKVPISVALIFIIIISNGYPLFLGNFAGYLQTYDYPEQYHKLYNKVLSIPDYNVLILPYVNPIRYDNLRLQGLDPLITDTSSMILPTILGNRESPNLGLSIWLLSSMQENKTHNLGKLLSGFGIKYIILRNDFISKYPSYTPLGKLTSFREKWYTSLEPLLDSQKELKIISNTTQYKIYENLNNATKIFTPSISAGGLTNFDSLLWISNLTSLSNVALYPSVSSNFSLNFLDSKDEKNMSATATDFIGLGNYAVTFNAEKGWTTNRDAFGYDHLLASRVNTGLFSASPDSLVSFELPSKYNNKHIEIWIKYLVWNKGGLANIQINGKEYPLSLFSSNPSLRILKIFEGQSVGPYNILIKNIHGNNYLEGLYIKDRTTLQHLSADKKILLNNSTDQKEIISNSTDQKQDNLISNPSFSAGLNSSGFPLHWDDVLNRCDHIFTCKISHMDVWDDNSSLQISTKKPHNQNTTSSIHGQEIDVKPNERYEIVTHMKLNRWAMHSHVALEGFNGTSSKWQELMECPSARNGPLTWITRMCQITIPSNVTKIALVLDAGWSSQRDKVARTWFDALSISKIRDENQSSNIGRFSQFTPLPMSGNKSSSSSAKLMEYNKVNPTLWNLRVSTSGPTTIAFAEPYDQAWEATVYKDGLKIGTAKSNPLYGAINSFQIKQTGYLDVELAFKPQQWYYIGFVISGLTFAFCIFYIIYDWKRGRAVRSASSDVNSQFL